MRTFISTIIFLFFAVASSGQSIALNNDSICLGSNVTATAMPPSYELATPTGTNFQNGVMFDVVATYAATITGFLISPLSNGSTYYLYYRTGTHVGHENSASGWTLVDSVNNISAGTNVNPGFNISQSIVAGQTLAFYITSNGSNNMYYGNGTSVGNTLASDSYLTIKEGVGKAYLFGTTYTPRTFVGSILYSPAVTTYAWNTNNSGSSITKSPTRSRVYSCNMTLSSGLTTSASAAVLVKAVEVSASANPSSISSGQSSTLTADVTLKRGLSTTQIGGNNQNGAMFDVVASKSLEITGFTVNPRNSDAAIEIFYKTGTHVGSEANSNAWTSIGTYANVPSNPGQYLELNTAIPMVAGQTLAFYITRTDADYLTYSNGTGIGTIAASASGLAILEGKGVEYPFGNTYTPRILNTIIHYTVDPVTNAVYNWSSGGSSASVVVSPAATTTYDVDVTVGGCTVTESVTVSVGIGIDELAKSNFKVYPNPATAVLNIDFVNNTKQTEISLVDLSGKVLVMQTVEENTASTTIPVNMLPKGLYLLKLDQNGKTAVFRIEVM